MNPSAKPEDTASRQRLLRLGRQLFALAIGIVGGIAAYFAGLPLPWVTGPLISVAAASILDWPIEGPLGLMPVAFVLMGASGGSGVTPEALGQIHKWPLSLAVLFITFPLGSWIGYRMLRRWGWDRDTAVLSALPGALSVITATAIDRGADVQRVAGVQTLRVVILVLFLPMIVIILYDVVQRKYLGWSPDFTNTTWYQTFTSTRLQEMEWHLHAVLFLMALGFGYVKDAHVRIELVRDMLKPRSRAWIELAGALLFMVPYCYVVIEYGSENALRAFHIGEGSDALTGLPHRFIIKGFLPLGFVFVALAGLSAALKSVVYLFGPASMRTEAGTYTGESTHALPAES